MRVVLEPHQGTGQDGGGRYTYFTCRRARPGEADSIDLDRPPSPEDDAIQAMVQAGVDRYGAGFIKRALRDLHGLPVETWQSPRVTRLWATLSVFGFRYQPGFWEALEMARKEAESGTQMTTAEAARRFGCTPQYIRRLVKAGRLNGRMCPDGRWAIDRR
jgi:excisionase family DNA binding protein